MVRARGVLVGSTSSNTELEAQGVEIRQRRASDNGSGAQRFGDAPAARKYVEATNDIVNHVADHELWYTLEREAMKRGTEALLDCTDGALDFANGAVSGHDIHHKGKEVGADALKLMVCMNIADGKTTSVVQSNGGGRLAEDGFVGAVGDILHSTKTNLARNRVQEANALDEEEVGAQGFVAMVHEYRSRDGDSLKSRSAWHWGGASHLAFKGLTFKDRNIGTVDEKCAAGVVWGGDLIVADEVVLENGLKLWFIRAS